MLSSIKEYGCASGSIDRSRLMPSCMAISSGSEDDMSLVNLLAGRIPTCDHNMKVRSGGRGGVPFLLLVPIKGSGH